jgi:1-deoxy-D-xylulose-5-phosphate synthase
MSDVITKIKSPQDLKDLSFEQLETLSTEIRQEIIRTVSNNGGHLSSNLGVVELTIALLRKFDFSKDRIVWDVGHQIYAYKMLTGRYKAFSTLRTMGGLAGFPKRCESGYDCFNTGHSSTSISAALGMIRANRISGKNNRVVAVIGDGALTGGMSFEALNDTGHSAMNLIVILNDNQMSINPNVGGLSRHLNAIRISKKYLRLKKKTHNILNKTRLGSLMSEGIELIKASIRLMIRRQKVIFEDLGFQYYGPVDGHDILELEKHLEAVKKIQGPVLVHVLTQKGKGYEFAEISPEKFHGIAPFEVSNGMLKGDGTIDESCHSFSEAFGSYLTELAASDSTITAVCPAMSSGTGLDLFSAKYPNRFFDVGIAEQHAMTMAAGMAAEGLKPVVAMYSTFLQRAFDQLLHDVALQNLHVVLCVDRAGIVGEDGETHQGLYDLALLKTIPGLTVLSPRNYHELEKMLRYALYHCDGPVAIRYSRGKEKLFNVDPMIYETEDRGESICPIRILEGNDMTMIAEGIMVEKAYRACMKLEQKGIICDLIDIRKIKPLDEQMIFESVKRTRKLMVLENGLVDGGLGSLIADRMLAANINVALKKVGVHSSALCQGKIDELFRSERMDIESIYSLALHMIQS